METVRRTPPVNATLTAISSIELVDDGGGGVTEQEVVVWEGAEPAYASEKIATEVFADGIHEAPRTTVVIPSYIPPAAALEPGDFLHYSRGGTVVLKRRVSSLEERTDYGFVRTFTQEV